MSPYVRKVRRPSGAWSVQLVVSRGRGRRDVTHVGTAHNDAELAVLTAAAQALMPQPELPFDVVLDTSDGRPTGAVPIIVGSRLGPLWDVLNTAWRTLGLHHVTGDKVFRHLVLARVLEPTSKKDALRVLDEAGVKTVSYRTVKRRLAQYATTGFRDRMAGVLASQARLGPSSLVLFDVSTLYFETDTGDGFREPGFSKERRLEPQILIGLLCDQSGFPLWVEGFPGNTAETTTMIPVVEAFTGVHDVTDVTLVADAGMMSEKNMTAVEAAGWGFIVGGKLPTIPDAIQDWLDTHGSMTPPDQLVLTQPITGPDGTVHRIIHYQYSAGRARRSLHGIDQQITKAAAAISGKTSIKRNRFVHLVGGTRSVDRALEAKARTLAGWKPYVTNKINATPDFVINAYHQLWHVEHAFRMSKHDLKARPIYHHKQQSINAHLVIVTAALAVSTWLEHHTGSTIKHLVTALRRYRIDTIRIGTHTFDAHPNLPDNIQQLLTTIP